MRAVWLLLAMLAICAILWALAWMLASIWMAALWPIARAALMAAWLR